MHIHNSGLHTSSNIYSVAKHTTHLSSGLHTSSNIDSVAKHIIAENGGANNTCHNVATVDTCRWARGSQWEEV